MTGEKKYNRVRSQLFSDNRQKKDLIPTLKNFIRRVWCEVVAMIVVRMDVR